jgi:hypothetical protein
MYISAVLVLGYYSHGVLVSRRLEEEEDLGLVLDDGAGGRMCFYVA